MSILKKGAKKDVEDIEPKEAFTEIEKNRDNPDFVILDVRTPEEYNKEHIENAHILDIQSKDFEDELEKMDKNKEYVVYCRTGRKSNKATKLMKKHGFKEVYNMIGGIHKWKSKRLPVTE